MNAQQPIHHHARHFPETDYGPCHICKRTRVDHVEMDHPFTYVADSGARIEILEFPR